jgi:hypothetical protein
VRYEQERLAALQAQTPNNDPVSGIAVIQRRRRRRSPFADRHARADGAGDVDDQVAAGVTRRFK